MLKYNYEVIFLTSAPCESTSCYEMTVHDSYWYLTLSIPMTESELCHPGQNIFNPVEVINNGEKNINKTTKEKTKLSTSLIDKVLSDLFDN